MWFITNNQQLSARWKQIIQHPDNTVYVSSVSLWECMIKYQLGKLPLPQSPHMYIPQQRQLHRMLSLALDEESIGFLAQLPALHRDPFDRMLICQALQHNLLLMTHDPAIHAYGLALFTE